MSRVLSGCVGTAVRVLALMGMALVLVVFVSAARAATSPPGIDLSTLGGDTSVATGINDAGQVVGYSTTSEGESHTFVWAKETGLHDIGALGSDYALPYAMNEHGQVVGYSPSASGFVHAFSWTDAGGMVDLGSPLGWMSEAFAVSDTGQVVGYTENLTGDVWHPFLWTQLGGTIDLGTLTEHQELRDRLRRHRP